MNILSALIATSFLVLTFVGSGQLFLKADRNLLKQQDQFVELTKKELKKGSISLIAASLTACLSGMLLFYLFRMRLEFSEAKYREKNYLCTLFLNNETSLYVKRMAKINISLRALYLLNSTRVNGVSTKLLIEALKKARNLIHFNYLSLIAKNRFCSLPYSRDYLKNFPYILKNQTELDVNYDETSKLRAKQWINVVWQNPKGIRLKKFFCIQNQFELSNPFTTVKIVKSQEIGWGEAVRSKCWSG